MEGDSVAKDRRVCDYSGQCSSRTRKSRNVQVSKYGQIVCLRSSSMSVAS